MAVTWAQLTGWQTALSCNCEEQTQRRRCSTTAKRIILHVTPTRMSCVVIPSELELCASMCWSDLLGFLFIQTKMTHIWIEQHFRFFFIPGVQALPHHYHHHPSHSTTSPHAHEAAPGSAVCKCMKRVWSLRRLSQRKAICSCCLARFPLCLEKLRRNSNEYLTTNVMIKKGLHFWGPWTCVVE